VKLIERQEALDLFAERVRVAASGSGNVLLVTAPPGTGKSSLLHAFQLRGQELGAAVLAATSSAAEQDLPMGVASQLLHAAALAYRDHPAVASLAAIVADQIAASTPELELPVLDGLCSVFLELSADRPLIIILDDVEHADAGSRQALLFLARRLNRSPITLVLSQTDRSGPIWHTTTDDLVRQAHCRLIGLSPLSKNGVRALAYALVGRDASRRLYLRWNQLSGGNPLLVTALAADYLNHARTWDDGEPAAPVIAARYWQAVLSIVHRCGEQVHQLAGALAVLGEKEGLGRLLGIPGDQLAAGLHALEAAGLTIDGAFRHEAARSAVLSEMSTAERRAMHHVAAEVTHGNGRSTTTVAEHLLRAGRVTGAWALDTLEDAAARALWGNRAERAVAYLRHARLCCPDGPRRDEITHRLVRAEWRLNPAVPAARLTELAEAAERGAVSGEAAVALVSALLWHGDADRASAVLDAAIQSASGQAGARGELIVLRDWLRCTHPSSVDLRLNELPELEDDGVTTPIATVRRLEAARLLADVLDGGETAPAVRAEQILRGCRPDDASFDAIVWTLQALTYADHLEQSQAWCETFSAELTADRAPAWCARLAAIRGEIAQRTGDMPAAQRYARHALELMPPAGWGTAVGEPLSVLVLACTAMGDHKEAARQLGHPVPTAMFETRFGLQYLRARGRHSIATGNLPLALRDFQLYGDLMVAWRFETPAFLPWRTDSAEALLQLGRPEEARALLETDRARNGTAGPRAEGRTLRLAAATSRPKRRVALLHRATDLLQAGGDRYEMALAMQDLADAYRDVGSYRRAANIARQAQVVAPGCGTAPPVTPTFEPRTAPGTDRLGRARYAATLTEAERRVATLAAHGYSNREIADRLWITVSTVEQHLTRAYRKLDISSRSDLPAGLSAAS